MADRARSSAAPVGRRDDLLRVLRAAGEPRSIASLAAELRLHPNTVRFHLDGLLAAGRVRLADPGPRRPGRPALRYETVSGMDPGGPRDYQVLAQVLLDGVAARPDAESLAVEAGRRWGRQRAAASTSGPALDRLLAMLEELGFGPERREAGEQTGGSDGSKNRPATFIGLRHCPFLELASAYAHVVCPVHLGMMQGAMREWNAAQTISRLEPFVEPDLCVAHLAPAD